MKSLTLLLIPLLFLSSCTIDWNDEKDKKIAELEKQNIELQAKNDDELFKKNKECFTYKDKTEKYSNFKNLESLFYSPVMKSCIGVIEYVDIKDSKQSFKIVSDILTNSDLFQSTDTFYSTTNTTGYKYITISFNEEVKYLKGEKNIQLTSPEYQMKKEQVIKKSVEFFEKKVSKELISQSSMEQLKTTVMKDKNILSDPEFSSIKNTIATDNITLSIEDMNTIFYLLKNK